MARKRMAGTVLKSWDEADQALREIGICGLAMENIEGRMNLEILELKQVAKEELKPLAEKKEGLELALKEWTELNRGDIKGKTRKLVFGTVGFRLSTKVLVAKDKAKAVIDMLTRMKLMNCLKIKVSLKKDELKKLPAETLSELGVVLKQEDAFGYDLDREKIKEEVAA